MMRWVQQIDPAFGHWLAGFMDGEGCFIIGRTSNGGYQCAVQIGLRDDDRAGIERIRKTLECGAIHAHPQIASNPIVRWHVRKREHCLRLVELFDEYPLRMKKARDFAIWREAVLEWQRLSEESPKTYRAGEGHDWSRMRELKHELESGRRYVAPVGARAGEIMELVA